MHVVVNNQVGFTTLTRATRARAPPTPPTSPGCSRCRCFTSTARTRRRSCGSTRLAVAFRQRFAEGCRHRHRTATASFGHNEGDEPRFTQPLHVRHHQDRQPSVREVYLKRQAAARWAQISNEQAGRRCWAATARPRSPTHEADEPSRRTFAKIARRHERRLEAVQGRPRVDALRQRVDGRLDRRAAGRADATSSAIIPTGFEIRTRRCSRHHATSAQKSGRLEGKGELDWGDRARRSAFAHAARSRA